MDDVSDLLRRLGPAQAPVAPVDEDGIVATIVGLGIFTVGGIVLALRYDWLVGRHLEWWLWVAVTGVAIGLTSLLFLRWRKGRRTSKADTDPAAGAPVPVEVATEEPARQREQA